MITITMTIVMIIMARTTMSMTIVVVALRCGIITAPIGIGRSIGTDNGGSIVVKDSFQSCDVS